jgi:hypothetical protein
MKKIKAWMDYNKKEDILYESIYFKRPNTKHTNPDVVVRVVTIIYKRG